MTCWVQDLLLLPFHPPPPLDFISYEFWFVLFCQYCSHCTCIWCLLFEQCPPPQVLCKKCGVCVCVRAFVCARASKLWSPLTPLFRENCALKCFSVLLLLLLHCHTQHTWHVNCHTQHTGNAHCHTQQIGHAHCHTKHTGRAHCHTMVLACWYK